MKKLDCTLYVASNTNLEELRGEFVDFLKFPLTSISFISMPNYEISVRRNDEYDQFSQKEFPDGFLYFKFIVDFGFNEGSSLEFCVQEVGKIVMWLWGKGTPAVASCDYEDLLPNKGGYNNTNVPWVS